ncbi:MAG: DUF1015 domain-containing protein [Gammaproteobacteria bacterium]|nr:DUF1015 domain-containing protein [Gammaproteobacteria bacterium]
MSLIRPFRGLCPDPQRATDVVAPPYDVLNTEEARRRVEGRPWSFLHISKPEIDLSPDIDPFDPAVYAKAAENLNRMLNEGMLVRNDQPYYYAYRLIMGEHTQVGLVATASVADYDSNRVRKHEFTRPVKEDDRVHQIDAVNAQTGPVLLAYPPAPEVDDILAKAAGGAGDIDVTADDGVRHTLWAISDSDIVAQLTRCFDSMSAIYIADGHHRSAAASRVCAGRRAANSGHTGEESYNYFLSVIFPHHEMKILDYNRVVKDLGALNSDEMFAQVGKNFTIESFDTAVRPQHPAEFGMYLDGRWYLLRLHEDLIPNDDPVARLDVSLLAVHLIEPILNIHDPRRDERIDFVGGIRGLRELERRVDSGEMAVAFSLYPTRMEDLMAVADANEVMPPKSTWFEPKLADGLVSHVLD